MGIKKRYKYDVELDHPDYFVQVFSDKRLTQEEIREKAIEKMLLKTRVYRCQETNQETGSKRDFHEIESETPM